MSDMPRSASSAPIEKALAQTHATQEKLSSGVNELAVTNAVLLQTIPIEAQTGDLALALEKNEALEVKVQECVDDLEDVGKALADEVARRKRLEQKLAEAKAEIAGPITTVVADGIRDCECP